MFYFYKIFHNLFYFTDLTEAYFFYNESLILLSNIFILSFFSYGNAKQVCLYPWRLSFYYNCI